MEQWQITSEKCNTFESDTKLWGILSLFPFPRKIILKMDFQHQMLYNVVNKQLLFWVSHCGSQERIKDPKDKMPLLYVVPEKE